jgi:hypothetical protein
LKHETFNSIIAALGLSLAAITAWHQFVPGSDDIELVSEGRVNLGQKLEINPTGSFDPDTGMPVPTAGPVTWKVRVYNAADRPVSIVSYSLFLISKAGGRVQYSGMNDMLAPYDAPLTTQVLPDNISARVSKAYLISLSIPFVSDLGDGPRCEEQAVQLRVLERCLFLKGRDLFANPVTVTQYGSDPSGPISVSWDRGNEGPLFAAVFETADGSEFVVHLPYFPEL